MPPARRGRPSRATIYARFAAAVDDLRRYGGLPSPSEAKPIWHGIWHLDAHHSTAIEGNTLVLREVEVLLDQGRAVGAKELKDYLEVTGYASAARWVYKQARDPDGWSSSELITVTEIRQIHREALSPAWEIEPHPDAMPAEAPGNFRQHDINPFNGGMRPPSWPSVPAELTAWVDEANRLGGNTPARTIAVVDTPEWIAQLHAEFERVHPFLDGNGRTGRLAMNLVLVRLGYPPAIVFKRDRARYLVSLDRADKGDPGPLGELLARSVIDNLQRFVVPQIAGMARLAPLRSLVTDELSYEALRQAARRGRLDAELGADGLWRSSQHAVAAYRANRFKRG